MVGGLTSRPQSRTEPDGRPEKHPRDCETSEGGALSPPSTITALTEQRPPT